MPSQWGRQPLHKRRQGYSSKSNGARPFARALTKARHSEEVGARQHPLAFDLRRPGATVQPSQSPTAVVFFNTSGTSVECWACHPAERPPRGHRRLFGRRRTRWDYWLPRLSSGWTQGRVSKRSTDSVTARQALPRRPLVSPCPWLDDRYLERSVRFQASAPFDRPGPCRNEW